MPLLNDCGFFYTPPTLRKGLLILAVLTGLCACDQNSNSSSDPGKTARPNPLAVTTRGSDRSETPSSVTPRRRYVPDTYRHFAWGSDGNTQSAPNYERGDKRAKSICIADNTSDDYADCELQNWFSCPNRNRVRANRCEWRLGSCKPWTYGHCETELETTKNFKTIIYSEDYFHWTEGRYRGDRLGKEVSGYTDIDLVYNGHGPSPEVLGQMAYDVVRFADRANNIQVASRGCSTHEDHRRVELEVRSLFPDLHAAAFERVDHMNVWLKGNQRIALSGSAGDKVAADASQTWSVLKIKSRDGDFNTVEQSYYACKHAKSIALNALERVCNEKSDYWINKSTCQLPNGKISSETCKVVEYFDYWQGKHSVQVLVHPDPPKAYWYSHVVDKEKRPVTYTLAEAEKECAAEGGKLPSYDELKSMIEGHNLFASFTVKSMMNYPYNSGFFWSRTKGEKADSQIVYRMDGMLDTGANPRWYYSKTSKGGFALCTHQI